MAVLFGNWIAKHYINPVSTLHLTVWMDWSTKYYQQKVARTTYRLLLRVTVYGHFLFKSRVSKYVNEAAKQGGISRDTVALMVPFRC